MKIDHMTQRFGYPETLQDEGKNGVGMTPKKFHYCSNKVNLLGLQCLTISTDLPYKGSALFKDLKTVRSYPMRGFYTYNKVRTLLGDLQIFVKRLSMIQSVKTNLVLDPRFALISEF